MFNAPAYPDLPGLADFGGAVMHSARWDHEVAIERRRVAVIGTGASAIQIVPAIAPIVDHLDVFQRSPAWIMPRGDEPFTAEQKRHFAEHPMDARRHRHGIYRFYEGNTMIKVDDRRIEVFEKYARAHLESSVSDPELRAQLRPDYSIGCKRVLLSGDFYPAVQRDNVELVTDAIDHVTASGIVTSDGTEHPVDVIVLATGYRATDYLHGLEVIGRGGRRLHDEWTEPRAYLGMVAAGYPNFFVFYGPNTNQGGNSILLILEAEARYVIDALADHGPRGHRHDRGQSGRGRRVQRRAGRRARGHGVARRMRQLLPLTEWSGGDATTASVTVVSAAHAPDRPRRLRGHGIASRSTNSMSTPFGSRATAIRTPLTVISRSSPKPAASSRSRAASERA